MAYQYKSSRNIILQIFEMEVAYIFVYLTILEIFDIKKFQSQQVFDL